MLLRFAFFAVNRTAGPFVMWVRLVFDYGRPIRREAMRCWAFASFLVLVCSTQFVFAIEGSLDPSFGAAGKVSTDFQGPSDDDGDGVAVQSDGKMIVAATTNDTLDRDFSVVRYNTNGSRDTSFGINGVVTTDFGGTQDFVTCVAIQSDGKIIVAGRSAQDFAVVRLNTNGTPDTLFGTGGLATFDVSGDNDQVNAIKIQTDGKIVLAGRARIGGNNNFALMRLDSLGVPDTTFDGDGIVTTNVGGGDVAFALAIQADGKIVAGGGSGNNFALVRYTTLGALDSTFDFDGIALTDFNGSVEEVHALLVQPDTNIVAAGVTDAGGGGNNFGAVRYTTGGALDTTFDLDGKVIIDFATDDDTATAAALQSDGKIVIAGSGAIKGNEDFAVARILSTGALDPSFDSDGRATTDFGTVNESANAVAMISGGKIVAAGTSAGLIATGDDIAVARYNSNGGLDNTFDSDGKVLTDIRGVTDDVAHAIARQSDGKILVVGSTNGRGTRDFAVTRYNTDGTADGTFGPAGRVITDFNLHDDVARAVAIQADGKILVAGSSGLDGVNDIVIARYKGTDGSLDTTFGSGGLVTTDIAAGDDQANAVAVQTDGKVVIAGFATVGTNENFLVARYITAGLLDTSGFGVGGVVTTDFPAGGSDRARTIVIQSDGKIVVAGSADNGNDLDFALARYSSLGALDTLGFGTNGLVLTDISGGNDDESFAITAETDGHLLLAGYSDNGGDLDFAVARYDGTNGNNDTNFGNGGATTLDFDGGDDQANGVAVQSSGKIVLGGTAFLFTGGTDEDFALARFDASGSPDGTFGNGGVVTTDTGGTGDNAHSMALQPDDKILLAGEWNTAPGSTDFAVARYIGVCPAITLAPASLPQGFINIAYNQTVSASGGVSPFVFVVSTGALPTGLTLDPATGVISGIPTVSATFNFTITVTDANTCQGSQPYSVFISPCPPETLTPTVLPDPHTTIPYNQTLVTTGGVAPYTYAVTSGVLPTGLTLDANTGAITGLATTLGQFSFSITSTDSSANNCTITNSYTVNVTNCLFCDDFEDGVLAPDWTYVKPTWTESAGNLNGTSTGKALAIATPVFSAGCIVCGFEAGIQSAGGTLSMFTWYIDDKNNVEILMKVPKDKWIIKQRSGGPVVRKASAAKVIDPNVFYTVKIVFDGTNFTFFVDDLVTPLITMPSAAAVPSGTVGFQAKKTTGIFGYITVN